MRERILISGFAGYNNVVDTVCITVIKCNEIAGCGSGCKNSPMAVFERRLDALSASGAGEDPVIEIKSKIYSGVWLRLVEHLVWDQGAAGSNPVTPIAIYPSNPVQDVGDFF